MFDGTTLSCRGALKLLRPRGFFSYFFCSYSVLMVPPEAALVYGSSSWIDSRDARSLPPPYSRGGLYTKERGGRGEGRKDGRKDGRKGGREGWKGGKGGTMRENTHSEHSFSLILSSSLPLASSFDPSLSLSLSFYSHISLSLSLRLSLSLPSSLSLSLPSSSLATYFCYPLSLSLFRSLPSSHFYSYASPALPPSQLTAAIRQGNRQKVARHQGAASIGTPHNVFHLLRHRHVCLFVQKHKCVVCARACAMCACACARARACELWAHNVKLTRTRTRTLIHSFLILTRQNVPSAHFLF